MFVKIFAEQELSYFLQERLKALEQEVHAQDKNYLLNVNETQYVDYLVKRYHVEPLVFHWNQISVSDREELISAERFPNDFIGVQPGFYSKQVITYHIPYSGEEELLKLMPSTRIRWTLAVRLESNCISFDIINWQDNAEEIKCKADEIQRNIKQQATNLNDEVSQFNNRLESDARQVVQARKNQLLKQVSLVASLGVPLKKVDQVPSTFTIPIVKKKVIIEKPRSLTNPFAPEPALDEGVHQEILKIIHYAGIEMERHPSIYRDKDEEALRDYFLMILSPHFQSATGETFNKTGKTDILIRHEKQNVFIAECVFWDGIKLFYDKINQLLGYLTWRDSKSAIVCFVKNKELNPVLKVVEEETPKHPCFVKYRGKKTEGWFQFEFHLKDDPTRGVQLAVLCFHFL